MKSTYTHTAATRIAFTILITFFFSSGNRLSTENVAMADVEEAIQEQRSMETRGTRSVTFETNNGRRSYVLPVLKRMSNLGYSDKTFSEDGELILQLCHHYPTATTTLLLPSNKTYCRFKTGGGLRWGVWGMGPQRMFKFLFQEGKYVKVGPKQVDGVEAIGFEVSDIEQRLFGGMNPELVKSIIAIERTKCTAWIDPKTKLPILFEGECEIAKCLATVLRQAHLKEVNHAFQWGVEIDKKEFLPDMPEGYYSVGVPKEPR